MNWLKTYYVECRELSAGSGTQPPFANDFSIFLNWRKDVRWYFKYRIYLIVISNNLFIYIIYLFFVFNRRFCSCTGVKILNVAYTVDIFGIVGARQGLVQELLVRDAHGLMLPLKLGTPLQSQGGLPREKIEKKLFEMEQKRATEALKRYWRTTKGGYWWGFIPQSPSPWIRAWHMWSPDGQRTSNRYERDKSVKLRRTV